MKPYCPPLNGRREYTGLNLDFNERTIPTSKKVLTKIREYLENPDLQMYPEYGGFEEKIAGYVGTDESKMMITNGSDQGIDLIFRTFTDVGDKVVIPVPSFAMFFQCAEVRANNILKIPYNDDYTYPIEKVLKEIEKGVKLVVICNPNNPTGTLTPLEDIEQILRAALEKDTLVYVDEAYYEFSKVSAVTLLDKYPNLIVTRTFSKAFGLCSLRIGYVIASEEIIGEMLKIRGPYDMNMISYIAAMEALNDIEDLEMYVNEVMNIGKPILEEFFEENGIKFYPSGTNFLFFAPENRDKTWQALKDNGILTRKKNGLNDEPIIRITIGTSKQMKQVINVFKKYIINS